MAERENAAFDRIGDLVVGLVLEGPVPRDRTDEDLRNARPEIVCEMKAEDDAEHLVLTRGFAQPRVNLRAQLGDRHAEDNEVERHVEHVLDVQHRLGDAGDDLDQVAGGQKIDRHRQDEGRAKPAGDRQAEREEGAGGDILRSAGGGIGIGQREVRPFEDKQDGEADGRGAHAGAQRRGEFIVAGAAENAREHDGAGQRQIELHALAVPVEALHQVIADRQPDQGDCSKQDGGERCGARRALPRRERRERADASGLSGSDLQFGTPPAGCRRDLQFACKASIARRTARQGLNQG